MRKALEEGTRERRTFALHDDHVEGLEEGDELVVVVHVAVEREDVVGPEAGPVGRLDRATRSTSSRMAIRMWDSLADRLPEAVRRVRVAGPCPESRCAASDVMVPGS